MRKIRTLFAEIGADESGVITYDMLQDQFQTEAVREYFESLGLDVSDAWSFFKLLAARRCYTCRFYDQSEAFGSKINAQRC